MNDEVAIGVVEGMIHILINFSKRKKEDDKHIRKYLNSCLKEHRLDNLTYIEFLNKLNGHHKTRTKSI